MRREIAKQHLNGIKNKELILPHVEITESHVWHLFVIRTKKRDACQQYLTEKGIGTIVHFPIPPHKQPAYNAWNRDSYPLTEEISNTIVSLPLYAGMKQESISKIIEACNAYLS